jgi:hypothetical protein
MVCPVCKAEYRSGFAHCADCHVELVEKLPTRDSPHAFAVLWRGEDPGFHGTLMEELDHAGIRYADIPLDVYLRNSGDPLNLRFGPKFGFAVSVTASDLRAARNILEKLLDREPENVSFAESEDASAGSVSMDAPVLPLHWDLECATLEVWSGSDPKRMRFLETSLREVGIPSRSLEDGQENFRVMVCPEDEPRAREIIHQVSEATPPENPSFRSTEDIWHEEPVHSYLFAWLPALVSLGIGVLVLLLDLAPAGSSHSTSFIDVIFAFGSFVSHIGCLWMLYQAVRYEIRPVRFVLLAFLPFSFVWYYFERYSRRKGPQRLPIAVRLRMSPPPSA